MSVKPCRFQQIRCEELDNKNKVADITGHMSFECVVSGRELVCLHC